MKKINFKPSSLQIIYLIIFFLLFSLIILTPKLINDSLYLSENLVIEEEFAEGALLCILLLLGILIINLYKHEGARQNELIAKIINEKKTTEERLTDSFKYIGMLNVQIQEIKSIFNATNKYPETISDFKKVLGFFSSRVFGIVNSNWILFRIINIGTQKTISEHFEPRTGYSAECPHISNKMLVEKQLALPFASVISNPQNLNILVACILNVEKISNEERIFVQAITNELAMIFVIFDSSHYKKVAQAL